MISNELLTDIAKILRLPALMEEIVSILNLPGDKFTDGQCLDLVAEAMEEFGYGPFTEVRS